MPKHKYYQIKNKDLLIKQIKKKFITYRSFADITGISIKHISSYINYSDNGRLIREENAEKISRALEIEFDELFNEKRIKHLNYGEKERDDKTDMEISEEIILGLKHNVMNKLLIAYSELYVRDIMSIINDIIIEASYLGVNSTLANKQAFIVKAIEKRRK